MRGNIYLKKIIIHASSKFKRKRARYYTLCFLKILLVSHLQRLGNLGCRNDHDDLAKIPNIADSNVSPHRERKFNAGFPKRISLLWREPSELLWIAFDSGIYSFKGLIFKHICIATFDELLYYVYIHVYWVLSLWHFRWFSVTDKNIANCVHMEGWSSGIWKRGHRSAWASWKILA